MNAEKKTSALDPGWKKKQKKQQNKSTVCLYQPSDADMHQDNISPTNSYFVRAWNFLAEICAVEARLAATT